MELPGIETQGAFAPPNRMRTGLMIVGALAGAGLLGVLGAGVGATISHFQEYGALDGLAPGGSYGVALGLTLGGLAGYGCGLGLESIFFRTPSRLQYRDETRSDADGGVYHRLRNSVASGTRSALIGLRTTLVDPPVDFVRGVGNSLRATWGHTINSPATIRDSLISLQRMGSAVGRRVAILSTEVSEGTRNWAQATRDGVFEGLNNCVQSVGRVIGEVGGDIRDQGHTVAGSFRTTWDRFADVGNLVTDHVADAMREVGQGMSQVGRATKGGLCKGFHNARDFFDLVGDDSDDEL